MKTTISIIKADIGSVGGHAVPSKKVMESVRNFIAGSSIITDFRVFSVGDDISILMTHNKGADSAEIHELAWNAFKKGTETAKEQGLYGAGQDLLADAFSGNVRGLGPASAEMEIDERPAEPFVVFAADKTDPGAYNLPLYASFADPMHNSGLMLSPSMFKGFTFTIMDVSHTEGDRIISLGAPEEIYEIAALLRDNQRYVVESIHSRSDGSQAVAVSTSRLHNIAGKYTGKDDPVMIVRTQGVFPATGEVLSPYEICHYVGGFMRGSHIGPLTPVRVGQEVSYFDGPPIVSAQGFCVKNGRLTESIDLFDNDPVWDYIRNKAAKKSIAIREQGFSGASMLGMNELEYGGIVEKLGSLDKRFEVRTARKKTEKVLAV